MLSLCHHVPDENKTPKPILPSVVVVVVALIMWNLDSEIAHVTCSSTVLHGCPPGLTYMPARFRHRVIEWANTTPVMRHAGIAHTQEAIRHKW